MQRHVALLGDSIFDNAAYTQGEPDVIGHLRAIVPAGCAVSLLARDGSTTGDVIDLRLICVEPSDYANAIEPSGQGGRKIAQAIAKALGLLGEKVSPSSVQAGEI
jgi:hypothetical protein